MAIFVKIILDVYAARLNLNVRKMFSVERREIFLASFKTIDGETEDVPSLNLIHNHMFGVLQTAKREIVI